MWAVPTGYAPTCENCYIELLPPYIVTFSGRFKCIFCLIVAFVCMLLELGIREALGNKDFNSSGILTNNVSAWAE